MVVLGGPRVYGRPGTGCDSLAHRASSAPEVGMMRTRRSRVRADGGWGQWRILLCPDSHAERSPQRWGSVWVPSRFAGSPARSFLGVRMRRGRLCLGVRRVSRPGRPGGIELRPLPLEDDGPIYRLNETAAYIWDRADGRHTILEISRSVAGRYGTTPTRALRDTISFLQSLSSAGLTFAFFD